MNAHLRTPEVLDKMAGWKATGHSSLVIKKMIKKEFNLDASPPTILKILREYNVHKGILIEKDDELKQKIIDMNIQSIDKLRNSTEILEGIIDKFRNSGESRELNILIKAIHELQGQLKLQHELFNNLDPQTPKNLKLQQTNYYNNPVEIIKEIGKILPELEKQGFIKILKPISHLQS